jgi:hypothetical protein
VGVLVLVATVQLVTPRICRDKTTANAVSNRDRFINEMILH